MNNSIERLIDGMVETLRREVIPNTEGEFARGQAFGVIYMLESLRRRTAWSAEFLQPKLDSLDNLASELARIDGWPSTAPPLPAIRNPRDTQAAEEWLNAGDACVAVLIDWLEQSGTQLPAGAAAAANAAINAYLHRQIRHEISTSAKPMFAEISLGREITDEAH